MQELGYSEYGSDTNFCHDFKIREYAAGKISQAKLNKLLSDSEGPYRGTSWAKAQIDAHVAFHRASRLPKSRLSRKQKHAILLEHGLQ